MRLVLKEDNKGLNFDGKIVLNHEEVISFARFVDNTYEMDKQEGMAREWNRNIEFNKPVIVEEIKPKDMDVEIEKLNSVIAGLQEKQDQYTRIGYIMVMGVLVAAVIVLFLRFA